MKLSPVKAKNLIRVSMGKMERRISVGSSSNTTKNSSSQTTTNEEPEDDSLTLSTNSFRDEKTVMTDLQEFCQDDDINNELFSQEETIYRFAAFHKFDLESTKKAIMLESQEDNHHHHYLHLEMVGSLKRQVAKGVIFPLSGLQTRKERSDVCYIHASRLDPESSVGSATRLIENLCYVLNDLSRTKEQCLRGVAVIINMRNLDKAKFSCDFFWKQMMMVLQGDLVPTTVNLVLFVDAPKWFHSNVWKTQARSMLTLSFIRKCRFIEESSLMTRGGYFADGCECYLPTQVGGWKLEDEIVEDYLDLKEFEYQQRVAK